MARYTEGVCRFCRRSALKLYLKGEKCYTPKCPVSRRPYPPGEHGQARRKVSDYGVQLAEKQKLRRFYGVLEAQFRRYFEAAEGMPGVTGENLLSLLERRIDNMVYRLNFATSRAQARQLISHGHFLINGRRTNSPSHLVRQGDVIQVAEASRGEEAIKHALESPLFRRVPPWLELDAEQFTGKVVSLPIRQEIDAPVQEQLVVEYYSR